MKIFPWPTKAQRRAAVEEARRQREDAARELVKARLQTRAQHEQAIRDAIKLGRLLAKVTEAGHG